MGYKSFGLQTSLSSIITDASNTILSGTFDPAKTNLINRLAQRTVPGGTLTGLGISPVNFLSTQDLSGTPNPVAHGFSIDPVYPSFTSRIFLPLAPAAAALPVAHFTYNYQTDTWTYVGKLTLTLNTATVHTARSIVVDDNSASTTGWSIHVLTTNATAANGGYFYAPNINASDFTIGGGTTIAAATTGDTQASKKVFWMQETGGTNTLTVGIGTFFDPATKTIYLASGTTNTVFYKFTYNTAITTTTASGVVVDCYNFKTGAYVTFGTALQTNALKLAMPKSSQNPSLIGQKCGYIASATFGFHFLLSDLSSGSTTVPSFVTWNRLGTGTEYSSLTWSQSIWSNVLDVEVSYSTTGIFMMKKSINNDPNIKMFGKNDPIYAEVAGTKQPDAFAGITIVGMFFSMGVLMANSTVAGQRGIYALNMAADQYFVKTYPGVVAPTFLITPVVSVDCAKALANAFVAENRVGGSLPVVQYRTSNFSVFPGTWSDAPVNNDLSSVGALTNISQVQFRLLFSNIGDYATNSQVINEMILSYIGKFDISDSWRLVVDKTSRTGESPVLVAAKQVAAYSGGPQTIYFNLYDSSKNLITQLNTTTHFAQFNKSTDGGATFTAMTGANDYTNTGAGTTVIQLNWAAPVAGVTIVGVRDVA